MRLQSPGCSKVQRARLQNDSPLNQTIHQPECSIEQKDNGVTISFGQGKTINAKTAIVAIPPPLRQRITFTPDLPAEHVHFCNAAPWDQ